MLTKRKSLNDDLIIRRGMSVHNISITVRAGLPFAAPRRSMWLEIVNAEVQKKSKNMINHNFMFSTRTTIINFMNQQNNSNNHNESTEDDGSFKSVPLDTRASEIMNSVSINLPIRIDTNNRSLILKLAMIIAGELKSNAEAIKMLSFVMYREQIPSNRRPCIPAGNEAFFVYRDVLESCIHTKVPSIYKHMMALQVVRDVSWKLLETCVSDLMPLPLRVRFLDMILVNGCVVLVSVMLTYLGWRQDALLQCTNAQDFVRRMDDDATDWLREPEYQLFWQKFVETHNQSFLNTYVQTATLMRLKAVSLAKKRHSDLLLLPQFQTQVFDYLKYSWIGFDVDHTLVEYRLPVLLKTSFKAAAKELQQNFIGLRAFLPPVWLPEIAQRGIAIDTVRGNFLHIAEDGTIQRAYHGTHEVSYFSINMLYSAYYKQDLLTKSRKIIFLYTAAEIIYAPLYAWLVDAFDAGVITTQEMGASLYMPPDIDERVIDNANDPFLANKNAYVSLSSYALRAAKAYYANGFWKTICSAPDLLIQQNPEIRHVLETLRFGDDKEHDPAHHSPHLPHALHAHARNPNVNQPPKIRLFVLTNGSWTHCNEVLKFAVGKDWLHFFDIVLTEANKDIFFDALNETPFAEVDVTNPLQSQKKTVRTLERNKIYAYGNVRVLSRFFLHHDDPPTDDPDATMPMPVDAESPRPAPVEVEKLVCYFGDHLIHDLYQPSLNPLVKWDLVAVVKEIQNLFPSNESNGDEMVEGPTAPVSSSAMATVSDAMSSFLDNVFSWFSWTNWLSQLLVHDAPPVPPDAYSCFFFHGPNGVASLHGKKVCETAILCVHSVSKLLKYQSNLKSFMIHHGMNRSSTRDEIHGLSKRLSAKVRAIATK